MTPPREVERDDFGRRLLPPIVYEPFTEGGERVGWKVPRHELATWDGLARQREAGLGHYSRGATPAPAEQHPFDCPNCGGPVSPPWTFCSRLCRITHAAKRRKL